MKTALVSLWLALAATPPEVEVSLLLFGDAGHAESTKDPVMRALSAAITSAPGTPYVVFLGDNIYPRGMPVKGDPERPRAERRLLAQVQATLASQGRGFFIPGNHDWARHARGGWDAVRRQATFLAEHAAGALELLPRDGCPGPVVRDVGKSLRLIALDTQWWLHGDERPDSADSPCDAYNEDMVIKQLRAGLADADGRRTVVVGHHPLSTGGVHGGNFSWKDHVFPLRAVKKWVWLPLPAIGSLYPFARKRGISRQDMGSSKYQNLVASIGSVLASEKALVYAAGHEHSLQVISNGIAERQLVSGAGSWGFTARPGPVEGSLYALGRPGFMRIDLTEKGEATLHVLEVDATGGFIERFKETLK